MIDPSRDNRKTGPSHNRLFEIASGQHGYFTTVQARASGFRSNLLAHHVHTGRFQHVAPGLYRLRDYPPSPYDEVTAGWLAAGKDVAVVSHESALELLDLSNVVPTAVHLTLARSLRYRSSRPGVVIHTTTRPLQPSDVVVRHGVRITSALRSILDAAEIGTAPEQIEMAIRQALRRGLIEPEQLLATSRERNGRVQRLVRAVLAETES